MLVWESERERSAFKNTSCIRSSASSLLFGSSIDITHQDRVCYNILILFIVLFCFSVPKYKYKWYIPLQRTASNSEHPFLSELFSWIYLNAKRFSHFFPAIIFFCGWNEPLSPLIFIIFHLFPLLVRLQVWFLVIGFYHLLLYKSYLFSKSYQKNKKSSVSWISGFWTFLFTFVIIFSASFLSDRYGSCFSYYNWFLPTADFHGTLPKLPDNSFLWSVELRLVRFYPISVQSRLQVFVYIFFAVSYKCLQILFLSVIPELYDNIPLQNKMPA